MTLSRVFLHLQLLSIIHEIQNNFDDSPSADVRVILLDILETFDKFSHNGF